MTANSFLRSDGLFSPIAGTSIAATSTSTIFLLGAVSAVLASSVNISTASYTDGPSVTLGSSGTWLVNSVVTIESTVPASAAVIQLWDGTTIIGNTAFTIYTPGAIPAAEAIFVSIPLMGIITNPAGAMKVSAKQTVGGGLMGFLATDGSAGAKNSTITALRIG